MNNKISMLAANQYTDELWVVLDKMYKAKI